MRNENQIIFHLISLQIESLNRVMPIIHVNLIAIQAFL